jgi:hypothetical protein
LAAQYLIASSSQSCIIVQQLYCTTVFIKIVLSIIFADVGKKEEFTVTRVHMVPFRREAGARRIVVMPVETEVLESNQLEDALGLPVDRAGLPFTEQ